MTDCVMPRHDRAVDADPGTLLCQPCRTHLRNRITALPGMRDWLQHHLAKPTNGGDAPTSGTREPPAPLRVDVLDAIQNTYNVTASWARLVYVEHDPEIGFPATNTLEGLAAFLVAHLDQWTLSQPWIDELAAEMADLHEQAWKLAPRHRKRVHLREPCPVCDMQALVLDGPEQPRPGRPTLDRHVECEARAGGCGTIWYDGEYEWLAHVLTGGAA